MNFYLIANYIIRLLRFDVFEFEKQLIKCKHLPNLTYKNNGNWMKAHCSEVLLEMCFCLIRKYRDNNVYMLLTCDYGMPLNRRSKMYLGSRKIRQMINIKIAT